MRTKQGISSILSALIILLFIACQSRTVYDQYRHTPVQGWEKNDTLAFNIARLKQGGDYAATVGVRINNKFPFKSLTLIVEQNVLPGGEVVMDTLRCDLISEKGKSLGQGVGSYQYTFPLRRLRLSEGDSLHVVIRHDMMREIMPGVSDIGYGLSL